MGRPRKSIAEHKANGTYRPGKHGIEPQAEEPAEPAESIERPADLGEDAARAWDELVQLLAGVIRRRDIPALKELARWTARSDRIAAELDKLKPGDKEFKALLVAAGIATDKVSDLTKRFGISPADRAKLKAEAPVVAVAKVPTRPKTKLDKQGPPKPAKKGKP